MKVFISADIEGTAGITNWDEARKPHADYPEHRQQMTREVLAACDGANAAGAKEILIKDAHATGRNILQADLPESVRLIRGWSGHPMSMVQELDKSFDAALFIGYHSKAGDETNPLAHTLTGEVMRMRINGVPTSEFLLHAYAAATVGVPVVFVSGDWQLCTDIKETNSNITAVAVSEGIGPSTVSLAPGARKIAKGRRCRATSEIPAQLPERLAESFNNRGVQVILVPGVQAHRRAHHPVRDQ
jgi:D-amino peptidase